MVVAIPLHKLRIASQFRIMNKSAMFNEQWFYPLLLLVFLASCKDGTTITDHSPDRYLALSLEDRLKPENATSSFRIHDDLEVVLFASEPMVINPTNIDVDEKGRVWVCESYNYAVPETEQEEGGGRISILEDTDGDGKADKKTIFYQGDDVNIALGIAVLGNKVYVSRSPDILVFTDEDGDDKPDKKERLFTGMGWPGDHSTHAIVFGPDGKFYFNMGNGAGPVIDTEGNIVVDQAGKEVRQNGPDYIGGMIFRCNPDGSAFEVLGHNFRNNYEVAVDSYGNLWQSDNDDDGNKSCRINFILEYGNYGYVDEMTRQGWQSQRTNIEAETWRRHWHQNDPGVVPNLLITGAGSPAGIAMYEGELLPEVFHGQIIHTDAGPNVARSYPVKKNGAGYDAKIEDLLKSVYDQWFRPVDVCVATDGSLFIADWYDPGVGGGAAADSKKGRIFRIAPNAGKYEFAETEITSVQTAITALSSPNQAVRYHAWNYLHDRGEEAEEELLDLYRKGQPVFRARALWLLGKIPGKERQYIQASLSDENPDIRIVGIRLARQSGFGFEELVTDLVRDPAPEVRREIAIGLHLINTPRAANLWAQLALQHNGEDRWYLEALGIGASNNWDACFAAWRQLKGEQWKDKAGKDIAWRSRSAAAIPMLAELIKDRSISREERERYFRSFDFHRDKSKQDVLLALLEGDHPEQDRITALALNHIDPKAVGMPPSLSAALERTLADLKGTREFVNLADRYTLTGKKADLLEIAVRNGGNETGVDAARLLLSQRFDGAELIRSRMRQGGHDAVSLIEAIQPLGSREGVGMLSSVVLDGGHSLQLRKTAIIGLGKSWPGESALLECVKDPAFDSTLATTAGSVLFNVYRVGIQQEAEKYIARPASSEGKTLPPIRDLIVGVGDAVNGKTVFEQYCQTCHVVNGKGTNFGPQLSEIGNKLSREGLYRAIVFPSEGINYGYEAYLLRMKDGSGAMGIMASETDSHIELRMIGGATSRYNLADITSKEQLPQSMMPDLSTAMSIQELTDVVEYLVALKKPGS